MNQYNQIDRPSETRHMLSNQNQDYMDDEINLIDLIYPVYKRRKFLIIFCLFVVLAAGIVTYFSTKIYEATADILPETKGDGSGFERNAAFMQEFGIAGFGGSVAPSEIFRAVLKSNDLAQDVFERYNYSFIMGINKHDEKKAAKGFAGAVKVKEGKTKATLSIAIRSNEPIFAADIANTYLIALDEYNRTNTITSAQRLRKYIEKRLEAANRELDQAQEELREFQEKKRAISISKQAEATLKVLSEMESQRVALEVEKAAKEKFYKGPHIEIEQLKAQVEALQKNIDRLTYSKEPSVPVERGEGKFEFYIPLTLIPALNFDESRLLLKDNAKTAVVTMLTTQLEQAKLDETKDMPTINVLDWAEPPKVPIKPRLKMNIILSFFISLFLGIFLIFILEFIQKMDKDPETSPRLREMKNGFTKLNPFSKKSKE